MLTDLPRLLKWRQKLNGYGYVQGRTIDLTTLHGPPTRNGTRTGSNTFAGRVKERTDWGIVAKAWRRLDLRISLRFHVGLLQAWYMNSTTASTIGNSQYSSPVCILAET